MSLCHQWPSVHLDLQRRAGTYSEWILVLVTQSRLTNHNDIFSSQLVLQTQNVPSLFAGVNCSFDDYVETEGRIYGGRIFCLSPSTKEVAPITQDQGKKNILKLCYIT